MDSKQDNFSSVSYVHSPTLEQILWCERWIEKRLKPLSKSNTRHNQKVRKELYETRSNVPYTHFIQVYKQHKKEIKKLYDKL